jgi:hypothetical protein
VNSFWAFDFTWSATHPSDWHASPRQKVVAPPSQSLRSMGWRRLTAILKHCNVRQVRQSLTASELKEMLQSKALHEVNKDIIGDADLEKLLNWRGDKALKKGGKGWDVVNCETGGVF